MARPPKQAGVERELIERSQRLYMDLLNAGLYRTAKSMNTVVRNIGWEVTERRMNQGQQIAMDRADRRPVGRPRKTESAGGKAGPPKAPNGRRAKRGRAAGGARKTTSNSRRSKGTRKKAS